MRNGRYIDDNGDVRWYLNNELHREDGPAVERADGSRRWYLHGKLHRTNGPAIEWANGTHFWYLSGKCHRTDGPAVEYPNGTCQWYLNDEHYTFAEWLEQLNTTPESRTLLIIKWSN